MENKLKNHLEGLFSRAVSCDAKEEILAELYANLTEKYNDLTAGGMSPEEAYNEVIDGIGDTEEIIAFINASGPKKDFDFGSAFEGFEARMRNLAKDLETPLKEVAQDLKNAAMSARDAAIHAKEPIKEMAKQVGHEVKNVGKGVADAVSNMEFTQQGKNTFRYDYEVPASGIDSLDIQSEGGDVTFGISQNDNIYVVELAHQPLEEERRANIDLRQGTLYISHGKSQVSFFLFGMGYFTTDFEIYLPKKMFEAITVKTSSGDIDLDIDLEARRMSLKTASGDIVGADIRCPDLNATSTSGDIKLNGLLCQQAELHSTSGDIKAGGELFDVSMVTTSGDMEFTGSIRDLKLQTSSGDVELDGSLGTLTASSVSGDIDGRFSEVPGDMRIESVSGDIKLSIPENDGFTLSYKRVSGDIRSDFNLLTSINSKDGHGVYRNGEARLYTISTVSGDIKLLKR